MARDYQNHSIISQAMWWNTLGGMHEPLSVAVCNGGAKGADSLVREWCKQHGIHCFLLEPLFGRYRRPAGPIRNEMMLDIIRPNLLIAFPGGSGTAGTIKLAQEKRIKVVKYDEDSLFP